MSEDYKKSNNNKINNRIGNYIESEDDITNKNITNKKNDEENINEENNLEYPLLNLKSERLFLGIALFTALFLALMGSVWTGSPALNSLIGFLPLLLTIVFLSIAVEKGLKKEVYFGIPFIMSFLFLIIVEPLNTQLSVGALTTINLILGLVIVIILILIEGREIISEEKPFKKEDLPEYIHSIEDKCKALNFVIGRVYRTSNGGTPSLRTKLRVDSEWYNKFEELVTEDIIKNKVEAEIVLHMILDRLKLLVRQEKHVFSSREVKGLKNIVRDKSGEDRIIDVLVVNDRDPVEHYYVGAVKDAEKIIQGLKDL